MSKTVETVSILGCGWLGKSLAKFLMEKGFSVKGSTRSVEGLKSIKDLGITPFQIDLNPKLLCSDYDFFDSEILIINFPPERREDILTYHPVQFYNLLKAINQSNIRKVLFVSSTSVYANTNNEVTEDSVEVPEKSSGKALRAVEEMLLGQHSLETTIIRFGGLIGGDRLPGRFLAGKKELKNGEAPVNLIHRDDCICIIYEVIRQGIWNETFNACMGEHPLRRNFYTAAAKKIGMPSPSFSEDTQEFKVVSSEKLKSALNYKFIYNNPLDVI